jgi:Haem-binding domain
VGAIGNGRLPAAPQKRKFKPSLSELFSTWNRYSTKQQVEKLKETLEEIEEGEMPPWFYMAVHRDIQLSARERAALQTWAGGSASSDGPTDTCAQNRPGHRD